MGATPEVKLAVAVLEQVGRAVGEMWVLSLAKVGTVSVRVDAEVVTVVGGFGGWPGGGTHGHNMVGGGCGDVGANASCRSSIIVTGESPSISHFGSLTSLNRDPVLKLLSLSVQ